MPVWRRSRSTPSRCAASTTATSPSCSSWCLDRGYQLRFIEQMPLDAQHAWDRAQMVSQAEILERLGEHFGLTPVEERGSAPAELFLVDGGPQTVGVIASVTAPFCGACDRARLTADGQLRNCLFARQEVDLRGPMRDGRLRRRPRRPRHRRDVGQEGRARHRPARLRAAAAPDVSDRWLRGLLGGLPGGGLPGAALDEPGVVDRREHGAHPARDPRRTAFAATTAKKGRKTAPAAKSQRIGWSMTTRSTKHAVRIDIVRR